MDTTHNNKLLESMWFYKRKEGNYDKLLRSSKYNSTA